MKKRTLLGTSLLLLAASVLLVSQVRSPERPLRRPVRGTHGAVAAGTDAAADAGMRMLWKGGNAVDAGVAAMFAAAVVEYSHFGFGGEAPILIRTAEGRVVSIAGVGTMPKAASAQMFRERKLQEGEIYEIEPNGLQGMVPVAGLMPALVPGMVDAGLVALQEFGTLSFAEVIAPAIEVADASVVDEMRGNSLRGTREFLARWPTSRGVFLASGDAPRAGDVLKQADLARTLRSMAGAESVAVKKGAARGAGIEAVRDFFYRGDIARRIGAFVKANGGLLAYEDMAAFRLKPEEALSTEYRGARVYKPGFWSQGPAMLETLNLLEGVDLRKLGFNSAAYIHTLAEAAKLGYADRDTYYGDPLFAKVPGERLLSKEYAAERRALLGEKASREFRPGLIEGYRGEHPSRAEIAQMRIDDALMAKDTTCVTAMDKNGVVFSATPSGAWLPAVIAGDTGIPLTQRAQSFLLLPGHPNELAGGKRPRVTLSPTLVTRGGEAWLALATPGGDNQDQALLQLLLNVLEFGMNAQNAAEMPRFQTRHLVSSFDNHAMNPGDLLLDERMGRDVFTDLSSRGHKVDQRSRWNSGASPVLLRRLPNGALEAGADPYGFRVARAW